MGIEIAGKVLGVIGGGNVGSVVASRAISLTMRVIAFDPFLSHVRAIELGVTKVDELDDLLARADFVTLHLPKTGSTANLLSAARIAKMKKGARLMNCARGGLVDEAAVAEAIRTGHLTGAAFDVFAVEPATESVLFGLPNVVCTPHLGASTSDAQGAFGSYMRLTVTTERRTRSVASTIYSDGKPRFIQIKTIDLEAEPMPFMLYTTNADTPGFIGALGTKLGDLGVNIATFALGRAEKGGEAIALLGVDDRISAQALAEIATLPQIRQAKALAF